MNQENYVIFKGTKDGVTVLFQPDVPFEELCTQLEQKVEEAGKFFDNVKTSLAFKGRSFTEEEEEKLLQIIAERTTMRITFVKTENNELKQISELLEKDIRAFNLTKFHRGSLRNGQKIRRQRGGGRRCKSRCGNQSHRQHHRSGSAQRHGTCRLQGHDRRLCHRCLHGAGAAAHCGHHHTFS